MIIESGLRGLRKGEAEETERLEGGAGKGEAEETKRVEGGAEKGEAEKTERVEGGAKKGEAEETRKGGKQKPRRKVPKGARVKVIICEKQMVIK